jgi:hypothetical protein
MKVNTFGLSSFKENMNFAISLKINIGSILILLAISIFGIKMMVKNNVRLTSHWSAQFRQKGWLVT